MTMIGIYNVFQLFDIKAVIFHMKRHTLNWSFLLVPVLLMRPRLSCLPMVCGLEPIPNYQVPCTVSWTAVVLCQAHIGHYPQPFLFFVWCQLGWHLLSHIFCHLPITYQFSFVLLEIHDINPPPSSSSAAAARWWMTDWQWSCQDLLLYDILNDRLLRFQMATVSFKFLD